MSYKQGSCVAY